MRPLIWRSSHHGLACAISSAAIVVRAAGNGVACLAWMAAQPDKAVGSGLKIRFKVTVLRLQIECIQV